MKSQNTSLLSTIASFVNNQANALCRFAVEQFLICGIQKGSLTLTRPHDTPLLFGEHACAAQKNGHPVVELHLENEKSFFARVATSADIGFAEAYMAGDFSVREMDDLTRVFELLIMNRDAKALSTSSLIISRVGAKINHLLHVLNRNSISGSKRNIEAHYDLSNELFGTFLGESWVYSCAYFDSLKKGEWDLDAAQWKKLDMVIEKARIDEGCEVLEIGCGWGEFAIRAVKKTGCRVTGITLSVEQLQLARERVRKEGLQDSIELLLLDYRRLEELGKKFDRIVSIEVMEAIGHEFLGEYLSMTDRMLKKDGLCVVQVITTPEERYGSYRESTDFIQKHVFPGGICPSFEAIVSAMGKESKLCVEEVENIGVHYATTLREWRRRFAESVRRGSVPREFDEVFVRKWMYYFCYCEAGFETRTLGVVQMVLTRCGNVAVLGGGPRV